MSICCSLLHTKLNVAAAHGHLHPFDSSVEDWSTFIERAELYFIAKDITEDARK